MSEAVIDLVIYLSFKKKDIAAKRDERQQIIIREKYQRDEGSSKIDTTKPRMMIDEVRTVVLNLFLTHPSFSLYVRISSPASFPRLFDSKGIL